MELPSDDRLRCCIIGGRAGGGGRRGGGGGRGRWGTDRDAGGRLFEEGGGGGKGLRGGWTMAVAVDMPLDETWDAVLERTIGT